ncbi:MAG: hypothetical protein NVS2B15_05510 [Pseudarthrobacter sp.]
MRARFFQGLAKVTHFVQRSTRALYDVRGGGDLLQGYLFSQPAARLEQALKKSGEALDSLSSRSGLR